MSVDRHEGAGTSHGGRHEPILSVILPTYNRQARLRAVLEGLARQTFPREAFEVVVVSDGSRDGTDEYLNSPAVPLPLLALAQDNAGPAAARNHGVAHARGRLLLFLDDDVVPMSTLLQQHVAAHQRLGPNTVVMGPMLTPPDAELSPWVAWEQTMLYKQYDAMAEGRWPPSARQFYTGNASISRQHVLTEGGFDVSFKRAEDVELAYRLKVRGLRFAFVPDAIGYHYAERSYESWLGNAYAYGRNDVILSRDRGHGWLLPTIAREFGDHHAAIRVATRSCVGRPSLLRAVSAVLGRTAATSARLRSRRVTRAALSTVYNLAYYQGVHDELGAAGWRRYWAQTELTAKAAT